MLDLFTNDIPAPLPEQLRPATLDDVLGQKHLIGPSGPLRTAFTTPTPHSFVLWGPPGVGKTTLALLASKYFDTEVVKLSAVSAGIKDIREALEQIKQIWKLRQRRTVLFVDEIHRFSTANQDALLPGLERGEFLLVAATTEQPSIEMTSALLSRMRVYRMQPLSPDDLEPIIAQAYKAAGHEIPLSADARTALKEHCQGDARVLLNLIEVVLSAAKAEGLAEVSEEYLNTQCGEQGLRFDSYKATFYNSISAFQKSIRGSDADGALYWLARMLRGGADPKYIIRRLMVIASEDIGLADPQALVMASSAAQAFSKVGMPEGGIILAHCVSYLALAPKSNHSYLAWRAVNKFLDKHPTGEVPEHLEDASSSYRYSHQEPGRLSPGQAYLPESVGVEFWLSPSTAGTLDEESCRVHLTQPQSPCRNLEESLNRLDVIRSTNLWLASN